MVVCRLGSTKPHSPGLPGDEEEAVVGGIDPVGASLAHGDPSSAVAAAAAAAAAAVVLLLEEEEPHVTRGSKQLMVCRAGDVLQSQQYVPAQVHWWNLGSLWEQ